MKSNEYLSATKLKSKVFTFSVYIITSHYVNNFAFEVYKSRSILSCEDQRLIDIRKKKN